MHSYQKYTPVQNVHPMGEKHKTNTPTDTVAWVKTECSPRCQTTSIECALHEHLSVHTHKVTTVSTGMEFSFISLERVGLFSKLHHNTRLLTDPRLFWDMSNVKKHKSISSNRLNLAKIEHWEHWAGVQLKPFDCTTVLSKTVQYWMSWNNHYIKNIHSTLINITHNL